LSAKEQAAYEKRRYERSKELCYITHLFLSVGRLVIEALAINWPEQPKDPGNALPGSCLIPSLPGLGEDPTLIA
jgi:hypothetical protein